MPKFVIEREIPGAGNLTDAQLREVSQKSVNVLKGMGPEIQWLHSYVTGDKVYCVYLASGRSYHPGTRQARRHSCQPHLRRSPTSRSLKCGVSTGGTFPAAFGFLLHKRGPFGASWAKTGARDLLASAPLQ